MLYNFILLQHKDVIDENKQNRIKVFLDCKWCLAKFSFAFSLDQNTVAVYCSSVNIKATFITLYKNTGMKHMHTEDINITSSKKEKAESKWFLLLGGMIFEKHETCWVIWQMNIYSNLPKHLSSILCISHTNTTISIYMCVCVYYIYHCPYLNYIVTFLLIFS